MNTTYAEAASQERNKLSAIEELKTRRQWVVFCLEPDKTDATRLTKVPYNANNGYKASTTKTKNWATYDQAVAAYRNAKNADGTPSAIEDRQEQLNALYAHFYAPKTQAKSDPPRHAPPISLSDHDIVEMATRAKNGASFARLFAGNTDEFQNDESRADWHLCVQLAFWTGKDTVSMDRIFRQSGLMREKWDEMHGATTYGEMTLRDAANFCTNIYNPRKRIEENINTLLEIIKRATQKRQSGDKRKASYQIAPWPVDLETVLKHLDMNNEQGDAELFAYCFEKQICYDVHEKAWYTWQGQYWKKNVSEHQIFHLVSGHLGAVYLRAAADLMPNHAELQREIAVLAAKGLAEGKKELEDLQDKYKQLDGQLSQLQARSKLVGTSKRVKGILDFVRGDERIYVSGDVWDNQPWLLACTNGVIELQTGELRDGQPEDYIRTICPTEWAGIDTACPNWERFLQEIFEDKKENRDSLIAFLKRFLGYGITGLTNEHIFTVLFGPQGRNGKDTMLSTLTSVLGERMSGPVNNEVFLAANKRMNTGSATPHLVRLQGKRLAWGSETNEGEKFNAAQVKHLTGGGPVTVRPMYGHEYTFPPTHKLLLMTNEKPHAPSSNDAFWARVCLIEFTLRFVENPSAPNERPRDKYLPDKLKQEASGILAWLVQGCMEWQRDGLGIPTAVTSATENYKKEEDELQQFIEDCCIVKQGCNARAKQLFTAYTEWAKDNNIRNTMKGTRFGRDMGKRFEKKHNEQGTYYDGIGLITDRYTPDPDGFTSNSHNPSGPRHTASQAGSGTYRHSEDDESDGLSCKTAFYSTNDNGFSPLCNTNPSDPSGMYQQDTYKTAPQGSSRCADGFTQTRQEPVRNDTNPSADGASPYASDLAELRAFYAPAFHSPDSRINWFAPGSGYEQSESLSAEDFFRRLEACLCSAEQQVQTAAYALLQRKLGHWS